MLEINDLNVYYEGVHVLKGINLTVEDGKIISLIGANGAGKTTTLKAVMGLIAKASGSITYDNDDITNLKTDRVVKKGVVLKPEDRKVFPDLTVDENIAIGAYGRNDKVSIKLDRKWIFDLFPKLEERKWQKAGALSGSEQQMLAIARALMSKPKLLLMDEPSLGMAPLAIKRIFEIIKEVNSSGVNVLLAEQKAKMALEISDYAYFMESGIISLSGAGKVLLENDEVKKIYLGE